jgi:methyl-accepting chemotaxis protein
MSLSFIIVSSISLNNAEEEIVSEVSSEVRAQIEQTVAAKSSAIAFDISNIFNESYAYPYKLANQISASIEGKLLKHFTRGQVEAMVRNTLSYSKVSSMYAQFDANKFYGKDSGFT